MTNKLNHIVLIIDRSGSMGTKAAQLNEQIRNWVKEQRENAPDGTIFSAILFDTQFDVIYNRTDIKTIKRKPLMIEPRGGTALYDAVMMATKQVGTEDALFMIITDGEENASSTPYNTVLKEIKRLQDQGCNFIYMSNEMNVRSTASKMHFNHAYSGTGLPSDTFYAELGTLATQNTQSYLNRGAVMASNVAPAASDQTEAITIDRDNATDVDVINASIKNAMTKLDNSRAVV